MTMQNLLPFNPTNDQSRVLERLEKFFNKNSEDDFMIISGSAGTGKTSILRACCEYLIEKDTRIFLSAPTGRAAKIISSKTNTIATTIHSLIYKPQDNVDFFSVTLNLKDNTNQDFSIYFIDESSMISDWHTQNEVFKTPGSLLSDLIKYIKVGNPKNKIVFLGDSYQLPPVVPGMNQDSIFSPALVANHLRKYYGLSGDEIRMTQVKRQSEGSPILSFATSIRKAIEQGSKFSITLPKLRNSTNAIYHYLDHFDVKSHNSTAIICLKNKDVDWWNSTIRNRLGLTGILAKGDHVIIQQNSFSNSTLWVKGEGGIISNMSSTIENYAGLYFVDVDLLTLNSVGEKITKTVKILLDSLGSENGRLNPELEKALYHESMKKNKIFRESRNPTDDKYLSALRLRHSFAITCHKAQGGEWDNIIIHPWMAYNNLKWLYTAVTRAKKSLCSY